MSSSLTIGVIGGGAAGFFGAITCAEVNAHHHVILLEKNKQILSKVRISGGGRCNVTHACFEPKKLVQNYPRGSKELLGPFSRFQPSDTIEWFESRGVKLKEEEDGRIFPLTDNSETIISCLLSQAKKYRVDLLTECGVGSIEFHQGRFILHLIKGTSLICDRLLVATGSSPKTYDWLEKLGHVITPLVPSLFTFNVPNSPLLALAGISVPKVLVKIDKTYLEQMGPLLLTHWGFSGPAILKLSSWGARILHEVNYKATLIINWLPDLCLETIIQNLRNFKQTSPTRLLAQECPFPLPRNLWRKFLSILDLSSEDCRWSDLSSRQIQRLSEKLHRDCYEIDGKSTNKEEFVTCGGIALNQVNFKNMESKICPNLYFAGEILDIDGVTGGFNFQNAWTTGWIAGNALAEGT